MGYDGVKTALAASKGEKVEANVDTGANLITKANMNSAAVAGTAQPEDQLKRPSQLRADARDDRLEPDASGRSPSQSGVAARAAAPPPGAARARQALRRHPCAEGRGSRFRGRRDPRHRRRERRRQVDADQAADRRHPRTSGEVLWEGQPVALATPHEAIDHGINAVHQEVVLCPHLTVAANMFLGDETVRFGLLQHRAMVRAAQKILDDIGFALPAGAVLSSLTIGQQQLVATARAAHARHALPDLRRADRLPDPAGGRPAVRADPPPEGTQGVTIVYICHRLEEVFELADRVSVLRDGSWSAPARRGHRRERADRADDQPLDRPDPPQGADPVRRRAPAHRSLSGTGFEDVSVRVRAGEIDRPLRPDRRRAQRIRAERSSAASPRPAARSSGRASRSTSAARRDAIERGIALAPESRRDQGLCLNLPVGLNLNLPIYQRLSKRLTISRSAEAAAADGQIRDLQHQDRRRATPWPPACPAATSRRSWSASGSTTAPSCSSSTSRPSASTSAPRPRSTAVRHAAEGRRRDHPDLVLPAGSLRSVRHAARVPARPAGRQPCRHEERRHEDDPGRGHRRLTDRRNENP